MTPPFSLTESKYDQNTFTGRFLQMLDVIDPRTLFTSKKKLDESVDLLQKYKDGKLPNNISNEELWQAKKIKQAILHPDTGEKIFMPFRMSGYVPFGSPIVVGLLLPNLTLPQMVFWQWLNQSHNACVNYANRNASKPTSMKTILQGYTGAITAAVSIAVGLTLIIKKAKSLPPQTRYLIQRFVPFPAVVSASVSNILLMRRHELHDGIEVLDNNGNVVGTSQIAASKALKDTAITRAFLVAPIFILPPLIMTQLEKTKFLKKFPKAHLPFNAVVCTLSFAFALPLAIALFPQNSKIRVDILEPEFASRTDDKILIYNKGL